MRARLDASVKEAWQLTRRDCIIMSDLRCDIESYYKFQLDKIFQQASGRRSAALPSIFLFPCLILFVIYVHPCSEHTGRCDTIAYSCAWWLCRVCFALCQEWRQSQCTDSSKSTHTIHCISCCKGFHEVKAW